MGKKQDAVEDLAWVIQEETRRLERPGTTQDDYEKAADRVIDQLNIKKGR
jgi:hypothetical protein